jgi:5'-nucleotidase
MARGDIPDDDGTDRRALLDDRASVSPPSLPQSGIDDAVEARLDGLYSDIPV